MTFLGVGTAFAGIGAEQQGQLSAPQAESRAFLGEGVAVEGDMAVVGEPGRTVDGNARAGTAYSYTHDGSAWNRQFALTSPNPEQDEQFGTSLAIDGDTLLVGQASAAGAGSVHVFTRSGGNWNHQQELTVDEPDISPQPVLGLEVALDGDTAMLGAPVQRGDNSIAGFVYVFTRSGGSWSQAQRLEATDGQSGDRFGASVDLNENTAIVGAAAAEISVSDAGAAYIFEKSGGNWAQTQRLSAPSPKEYARFGTDVALNGTSALVGAMSPSAIQPARQGAAHIFEKSGGSWTHAQGLSACDGSADNEFGISVALQQDLALVGARGAQVSLPMAADGDHGAVYAYTPDNGSWRHADKLAVESTADFGTNLALSGNRLVVADPGFVAQPEGGSLTTEAGRAFAFSVDPSAAGGGETVCDGDSNGDTGIGSDTGRQVDTPTTGCATSGDSPTPPIELLAFVGLVMFRRRITRE